MMKNFLNFFPQIYPLSTCVSEGTLTCRSPSPIDFWYHNAHYTWLYIPSIIQGYYIYIYICDLKRLNKTYFNLSTIMFR